MTAFAPPSHFAQSIQSAVFTDGLVTGYQRYQTGYQQQMLTDVAISAFCVRNSLDRHDPADYNLGYLAGWFVGLARLAPPTSSGSASSTPPASVAQRVYATEAAPREETPIGQPMRLGNAFVLLTKGDALCNGYQAGHLSYLLHRRAPQQANVHLIRLIMDAIGQEEEIALTRAGFVASWLLTAYRHGHIPDVPQATPHTPGPLSHAEAVVYASAQPASRVRITLAQLPEAVAHCTAGLHRWMATAAPGAFQYAICEARGYCFACCPDAPQNALAAPCAIHRVQAEAKRDQA